jgi:hypothetical protein
VLFQGRLTVVVKSVRGEASTGWMNVSRARPITKLVQVTLVLCATRSVAEMGAGSLRLNGTGRSRGPKIRGKPEP